MPRCLLSFLDMRRTFVLYWSPTECIYSPNFSLFVFLGYSNEVDRSVNVVSKLRNQAVQVHGEVYTSLKKTESGYEVHVFGKNGKSSL